MTYSQAAYNPEMDPALRQLTKNLARLATNDDISGDWPEASIQHLTDAGAWAWIIPERFGGIQLDPVSMVRGYEAVGAGSLACLLILSQRDGACEFIASCEREDIKGHWLPLLCRHKVMTSIGISQLTTSQRRGAILRAKKDGKGYLLNGMMPWVTAAEKCAFVVTGAVTEDGQQVLAMVPTNLEGVQIDPAMQLMALEASRTSEVHLKNVRIGEEHVLRGPTENALLRNMPVKSLVVSSAGLGLAGALVHKIQRHARKASDAMLPLADDVLARYTAIRERIYIAAQQLRQDADIPKTDIRVAVNELLMRLAITCMTFAKGSGFIRQRDAQRLVREAMFFLVWSATDEVRVKTLSRFLDATLPDSKSLKA